MTADRNCATLVTLGLKKLAVNVNSEVTVILRLLYTSRITRLLKSVHFIEISVYRNLYIYRKSTLIPIERFNFISCDL